MIARWYTIHLVDVSIVLSSKRTRIDLIFNEQTLAFWYAGLDRSHVLDKFQGLEAPKLRQGTRTRHRGRKVQTET